MYTLMKYYLCLSFLVEYLSILGTRDGKGAGRSVTNVVRVKVDE